MAAAPVDRSFAAPLVLAAYRRAGRLGVLVAVVLRAIQLRRHGPPTGWVAPVAPQITELVAGRPVRRTSASSIERDLGLPAASAAVLTEDNYPMS